MSARKRKVAVFDVDGTIFRSSLFIQLVEELIKDGYVPKKMRKAYAHEQNKWVNREGTYDAYVDAMVRAFKTYIKSVYYGDFRDAAKEVVDAQWKRVYRYPRALIKKLKKQHYYLLAVSKSPKTILDLFCPKLGFDKVYGLMYEIDERGRLTGRVTQEYAVKADIVKRAVEKEGLTLKDSIGVGDSEADIPFLNMVSKPICFNPSSKLYRYARRKGWDIVVERKDVIYEL